MNVIVCVSALNGNDIVLVTAVKEPKFGISSLFFFASKKKCIEYTQECAIR